MSTFLYYVSSIVSFVEIIASLLVIIYGIAFILNFRDLRFKHTKQKRYSLLCGFWLCIFLIIQFGPSFWAKKNYFELKFAVSTQADVPAADIYAHRWDSLLVLMPDNIPIGGEISTCFSVGLIKIDRFYSENIKENMMRLVFLHGQNVAEFKDFLNADLSVDSGIESGSCLSSREAVFRIRDNNIILTSRR